LGLRELIDRLPRIADRVDAADEDAGDRRDDDRSRPRQVDAFRAMLPPRLLVAA
jgi:hypothetical protein